MRELIASPSGSRTVGSASTLTGHVEVADHAADDRELLGVLLAEIGDVGLDGVEELGDDGGDAAEVLGAALRRVALEDLGEALDLDPGREALWVDLLDRRRVDEVDAGLGREPRVALLVARIAVEVLARPELRAGLTKRLMTTTSHSSRAARSSERWPSCR